MTRNYYFEKSHNEICDIITGRKKADRNLVSGSWAIITSNNTSTLVIITSEADRKVSGCINLTRQVDTYNTLPLKGSADPGFYWVQEVTDLHPDGLCYSGFCTGSTLYRCDVGFVPTRRMRLDRRIKSKPATVGDLEQIISKAVQDEGLKEVLTNLLNEEKDEDKKKAKNKPPKPAPTE